MWEQAGWNQETCGDIFESIFAFVKLRNETLDGHAGRESEIKMAAFIDSLCYCTWAYVLLHAEEKIWHDFSIFRGNILETLMQHDV